MMAKVLEYLRNVRADLQVKNETLVIPILPIVKDDLPLRTEITYWMKQCNIDWHYLFFLNDLKNKICPNFNNVTCTLVDCNVANSVLKSHKFPVTEVIDHHEVTSQSVNKDNCSLYINERCGSCSSLVAEIILKKFEADETPLELLQLLYGAILTDSCGLSEVGRSYGKVTPKDETSSLKLEQLLNYELNQRSKFYEDLNSAKFDIDGLTINDILRRDTKIAESNSNNLKIVCSTITGMDIIDVVSTSDFKSDADKFCLSWKSPYFVGLTNVQVLPGDDAKKRGLILYSISPDKHPISLLHTYLAKEENNLQLEPLKELKLLDQSMDMSLSCSRFGNLKVSRKTLLPLLIKFIENFDSLKPSEEISQPATLDDKRKNKCGGRRVRHQQMVIDWLSIVPGDLLQGVFNVRGSTPPSSDCGQQQFHGVVASSALLERIKCLLRRNFHTRKSSSVISPHRPPRHRPESGPAADSVDSGADASRRPKRSFDIMSSSDTPPPNGAFDAVRQGRRLTLPETSQHTGELLCRYQFAQQGRLYLHGDPYTAARRRSSVHSSTHSTICKTATATTPSPHQPLLQHNTSTPGAATDHHEASNRLTIPLPYVRQPRRSTPHIQEAERLRRGPRTTSQCGGGCMYYSQATSPLPPHADGETAASSSYLSALGGAVVASRQAPPSTTELVETASFSLFRKLGAHRKSVSGEGGEGSAVVPERKSAGELTTCQLTQGERSLLQFTPDPIQRLFRAQSGQVSELLSPSSSSALMKDSSWNGAAAGGGKAGCAHEHQKKLAKSFMDLPTSSSSANQSKNAFPDAASNHSPAAQHVSFKVETCS